jgi:hypothetical protein
MPIIVKPIKELSKKIEPSRWSAVFEPLDRRSPLVQVAGRYVLSSCDQRLSSNSHGHGDHKWGTVKCTNAPAKLVMFTVVIVQYCVIMFIKFKIRVNIEASTFDLFSLATKMLLRYYVTKLLLLMMMMMMHIAVEIIIMIIMVVSWSSGGYAPNLTTSLGWSSLGWSSLAWGHRFRCETSEGPRGKVVLFRPLQNTNILHVFIIRFRIVSMSQQ